MDAALDLTTHLAQARSLLFVPGNRPERFAKALASGADGVVLDLEDSVPPTEKASARQAIAEALPALASAAVPVVIRINAVGSEAGGQDLAWLARLSEPVALMLAKAEQGDQLRQVREVRPQGPLLPLIESASGLLALAGIAAAPGVVRLVVGHLDFMANTGLRSSEDERELDGLRFQVAMQTRAHRLAPAIDGVTVSIDDQSRLAADTRRAMNFGFGGKLCIHPRQIATVHATFAPTEQELAWARRVIEADSASSGAAVQLDGRMVDLPVVQQARATLARARG